MGILQALGMRFLAASGAELAPGPENLATLASIDISGLDARVGGSELTILCDVDNPLLGERGAARVFGPQKGASPGDVEKLEHALGQFRQVIQRQTGKDVASMPGGGAAGGVAAGLYALLKAKLVKGADYFLDATRFDEALAKSDLVITGEGRLDAQTLQGKAPMGVALRARRRAIRVVALAGRIDSKAVPDLRSYFDQAREITPPSIPMGEALTQTAQSLERAAFELGKSLLQT
jgi:glycerate kinase